MSVSLARNLCGISCIRLINDFHTLTEQFVNIDGSNCGEKAELFWGIRAYEIALAVGVKFYVWGNLDYGLKKGNWNPKFRCGTYDGKGRVGGKLLFYRVCWRWI
jgi:hypothetical protein